MVHHCIGAKTDRKFSQVRVRDRDAWPVNLAVGEPTQPNGGAFLSALTFPL